MYKISSLILLILFNQKTAKTMDSHLPSSNFSSSNSSGFSSLYANASTSACDHPTFLLSNVQRLIVHIFGIPQCVCTITLNLLLFLTFLINRDLRTAQHFYFFNLAFCDLIIGCFVLPSRLALDLSGCWPSSHSICRIYKLLDWITTSEAAYTVILIAYSRYRIISRGAVFTSEETARRVLLKIALTWIFNILLYGPVQFVDVYTGFSITSPGQCNTEFFQISWLGNLIVVIGLLPPLIVAIIYSIILVILRKRSLIKPAQSSSTPENALRKSQIDKTAKQTRTMLLLTLSFLVTSCPLGIITIVTFAVESTAIARTTLFLFYLLYLNSLINTVIYTSKVPSVQVGLQKLFCAKFLKGRGRSVRPQNVYLSKIRKDRGSVALSQWVSQRDSVADLENFAVSTEKSRIKTEGAEMKQEDT
ncbi:hypothetical protein RvY_16620 [Ramazzottius varieornatus]|uniref:G-protein coupled receptors family 1 profile domain-containing protein n=1 Tax=Ramazzottius varieornatus TaxID=947166 RepID=A0A1D1W6K1_RAMVA|nr:hypothetical protein RvY_16620 [Ramazzottius varieornatus]